jgi:hypothetical protein
MPGRAAKNVKKVFEELTSDDKLSYISFQYDTLSYFSRSHTISGWIKQCMTYMENSMNNLNLFRKVGFLSSSLKGIALLVAWGLVLPSGFGATAEAPQSESEAKPQKQQIEQKVELKSQSLPDGKVETRIWAQSLPDGKVETRIWVNGKEVRPDSRNGVISFQIGSDSEECAECTESAEAKSRRAEAVIEQVESALRSAGVESGSLLEGLKKTLKEYFEKLLAEADSQSSISIARNIRAEKDGESPKETPKPPAGEKFLDGDSWKSQWKAFSEALPEHEQALKDVQKVQEQAKRMLEKMGHGPFTNWPAIAPDMGQFRKAAPLSKMEARLEQLEKRLKSLENPPAMEASGAAPPAIEQLRRVARRIQNQVASQNMTAEEGLERLLRRVLSPQQSGKEEPQSME